MLKLKVPDMSCGHCVSTIEKAVRSIDPKARVSADLESSIVTVETAADKASVSAAVRSAGYENSEPAA